MTIELNTTKKGYSLVLNGEISHKALNSLLEQARAIVDNPKPTVVDWSQAGWIHFAGIQALLSLKKTLDETGKTVTFTSPSPLLTDALREFKLNGSFGINT